MKCCSSCFNDEILKNYIEKNGESGNCDFCNCQNVQTIDPPQIYSYFSVLSSIYIPTDSDTGNNLPTLINDDWNIISSEVNLPTELLSEILDPDVVLCNYEKPEVDSDHIQTWDEFRNEIVYKNRFFPSAIPHKDKLIEVLSSLNKDLSSGEEFYRCRIQNSDTPYKKNELGKPPADRVKNGRVNPIGISYLYLASKKDIAIHEVRPHIGHLVSVAKFQLLEKITVIDLRQPELALSPFIYDEDTLLTIYTNLNYIRMLSTELSSPVIPDKTDTAYLPSQYLCELIKTAGFEGVIYNSSVSEKDGYNLALFNDSKVEISGELKTIKISNNLLKWTLNK